jgi:putative hemolysin
MNLKLFLSVSIIAIITGCCPNLTPSTSTVNSNSSTTIPPKVQPPTELPTPATTAPSATQLANPASEKCIKDGYRLEFIGEQGVPVTGMCINEREQLKCEEWSYFRGECRLTK